MYSKLEDIYYFIKANIRAFFSFFHNIYLKNKYKRKDEWYRRICEEEKKEKSRRRLEPYLVHFSWDSFGWDYERTIIQDKDRLDLKNIITLGYRFSTKRNFYRNVRCICSFLPFTVRPVFYYQQLLEFDLYDNQPIVKFRLPAITTWTRKIRKIYGDPRAVDFAVIGKAFRLLKEKTIKHIDDTLAFFTPIYYSIKTIRKWRLKLVKSKARIIRDNTLNPTFLFQHLEFFLNLHKKKIKDAIERNEYIIRHFLSLSSLNSKGGAATISLHSFKIYQAIKLNAPNAGHANPANYAFFYVIHPLFTYLWANKGWSGNMAKRPKSKPVIRKMVLVSVKFLKPAIFASFLQISKYLNAFQHAKPVLNFYFFSKRTLLPITIGVLFIFFNFIVFKLSFLRVGANWFAIFLFVFWLLSGFNFFTKHARYGKHTTANQRFWKRTLMIFWLIEGFLFVLFFYYALNASAEPLFMYDQVGMFNRQLQDIRGFIFNVFLIVLIINLIVYLLITIKYTTFRQHSLFFLVITLLLVYILLVESYQFYYLTNYYDESSWVYSEDEQVWELDYEIPRSRNKSHFMTLIILAKFWHYIFIFACWAFFVMKALELCRTRYAILAMNLQNLLIFYAMAWVCMYAWLKWFLRRFMDQQYYWFFTSYRPTLVNSNLVGIKHLLNSTLSSVFFDFFSTLNVFNLITFSLPIKNYLSGVLSIVGYHTGYGSTLNGVIVEIANY